MLNRPFYVKCNCNKLLGCQWSWGVFSKDPFAHSECTVDLSGKVLYSEEFDLLALNNQ